VDLLYKVELKGRSLLVSVQQRGSNRILYLDTLKTIAKERDKDALAFLIKIQLAANRNRETLNFQRIEIPPAHVAEALALMDKTGRLIGKPETAPIVKKPLSVLPRLVLTDASGCFANLWMDYGDRLVDFEDFGGAPRLKKEEAAFEKDLIEAGYQRKMVGASHYYCSTEKVKDALQLLLDVGWQIVDAKEKPVCKQELDIREENGTIVIRGLVRGLFDPKIQMEGVWEGEILRVKKSKIGALLPLFGSANVKWEENLLSLAEGLKKGATVETALPDGSFRGELLPYQQKGVDWLSFLYRWGFSGLLADEMGLGKTVQVLAFLSRLRTNLPVLIVAPTSLLFNWRAEIARFLPTRGGITLISYTTLRLNPEQYAAQEFEAIILDESNAIKTATTQTARAACKLKARIKLCLSGTPMENRLDELWSQFYFLMPDLLERGTDLETVKRRVRPFLLRRRKEEVQLDLPEKIEQIAWVEMDGPQAEVYETYKKGIKLDGATRMEILEAILRLRQICCDPRLVGSEVVGSKLQMLIEDVTEAIAAGRKVLVFSQFTSMLQLIRAAFPDALYLDGSTAADQRGELVKRFQEDPNASLFLLSIKAGGVGLNLTAADYVLLFDPWWNEAVERQAIDRAHRIGQKKTVIAKRYLVPGTIEEKMLHLKRKKQEAADQLLDFEGGGWSEADLLELLC
jgi:superfamily II DNA or RNA helicase